MLKLKINDRLLLPGGEKVDGGRKGQIVVVQSWRIEKKQKRYLIIDYVCI